MTEKLDSLQDKQSVLNVEKVTLHFNFCRPV